MKRLLITTLQKIVAGYSGDLDLTDFEKAKKWAIENIGDVELYDDDDDDDDEDDEDEDEEKEERSDYELAQIEEAEGRIYTYMDKYSEVSDKSSIEIYRSVCLDDIKQLDLDDIGIHWSFEAEGVGCYGSGRGREERGGKGANEYVLTGVINPKDIDWEYGFTSFMYYGEDQWECALNNDSPVTITHIDDKKLEKPLKARTQEN